MCVITWCTLIFKVEIIQDNDHTLPQVVLLSEVQGLMDHWSEQKNENNSCCFLFIKLETDVISLLISD